MSVLGRFAAVVDRAALRTATLAARSSRADALDLDDRLERLEALGLRYGDPRWIEDPESFFGPPAVAELQCRTRRGSMGRTEIVELEWPSGYTPFDSELAEQYHSFEHNCRAHARWFRSEPRRPTVIAIHGYGGGIPQRESWAFPVRRWSRAGLDTVLFTLPFHGSRRAPGDRLRFPSSIPGVTIEGFRQAMHDLRALIGALLADGVPAIGAFGMSLGGYTTALLATVDSRLAFAVPMIPLCSLADYARDQGRYVGSLAEQQAQRDGMERVYRVVSPVSRPSRLPSDRVWVLAGDADHITPRAHAGRLADHFGCEIVPFEGGHVLQVGRRRAFEATEQRLAALGITGALPPG